MIVSFTKTDNTCYNDKNGSISIESVVFTEEESLLYGQYTILWYGDFNSSSISADTTILRGLANGTYSFQISSLTTANQSSIYYVDIVSPQQFKINAVKSSYYSCVDFPSYVYIEVSGGTPPYTYNVGPYITSSEQTETQITGIPDGLYSISVIDDNNCVVQHSRDIRIISNDFSVIIDEILAPNLLDGLCELDLSVVGKGPFSLSFINDENPTNNFYVDFFETKYLISNTNNIFKYRIIDKIYPGNYKLIVKNSSGCETTLDLVAPNINPMSVDMSIVPNDIDNQIVLFYNTIPIFDTILVPYSIIENNLILWNYIKSLDINNNIKIRFNNTDYNFKIVRNILNKYCLVDGKLEILRLGNESKDWFYYFHISQGININDDPAIVGSTPKLIIEDVEYPITFGLSNTGELDSENISLIRGSLFLPSIGYPEFYDTAELYLSINEPQSINDYKYYVNNIQKSIVHNFYVAGPITIINFLNEFNRLNELVTLQQSYCEVDQENYRYLINIKNLIQSINDFENLSEIFIFNKENALLNSSISLFISGNESFPSSNNQSILNAYNIEYYYFDNKSTELEKVYRGSSQLTNELLVNNIPNGYYVVRISDIFGNIPKILIYDQQIVDYDNHFLGVKNFLKIYNSNLINHILYGDIMFYIGFEQEVINNSLIPTTAITQRPLPTAIRGDIIQNVVKATQDNTETGILNIRLPQQNIRCYFTGPKNYHYSITRDTRFENLIPGVYTIYGDEQDLINNNCHQNYTKIFVTKGTSQDISISFISYQNKIYIKDN